MKKLLFLALGVILLTSCKSTPIQGEKPTISYEYSNMSTIEVLHNTSFQNVTTFTYVTSDDIKYRVFMYDGIESGAIFVINETKEKLEIEKLRNE